MKGELQMLKIFKNEDKISKRKVVFGTLIVITGCYSMTIVIPLIKPFVCSIWSKISNSNLPEVVPPPPKPLTNDEIFFLMWQKWREDKLTTTEMWFSGNKKLRKIAAERFGIY